MKKNNLSEFYIKSKFSLERYLNISKFLKNHILTVLILILSILSVVFYIYYLNNGLGLAYNDARSHLDISRRVVEGLKPGLAQLGSVWLPLPHLLMVPLIWNNFLWHSGLAGSLISMVSYVLTGVYIYLFIRELNIGILGRIIGVAVFAIDLNILYLQSTAMTELLLLATMTAGSYELMLWFKKDNILNLIKAAFWIMLSTLTRYDGWFLLFCAALLILFYKFKTKGYKVTEGIIILFTTLGALGIVMWFAWNALIFKDPLYFVFGPFSAKAQQDLLSQAGVLATKSHLLLSLKVYLYALMYNSGAFTVFLGLLGAIDLWINKKISKPIKLSSLALLAPLVFNILALYLGHSVLYVQGISGNTWFNVRYGIMLLPSIAIFTGYLIGRHIQLQPVFIGLLLFTKVISFISNDAVTIDDARIGSSQKNVSEVSSWLKQNATDDKYFILISAASHDAIIFSSGLPMKKFIHEGTGVYWEDAIALPDRWARWIIMRTYDHTDLTWKSVSNSPGFQKYKLVNSFPFADIYELKPEYLDQLNTQQSISKK